MKPLQIQSLTSLQTGLSPSEAAQAKVNQIDANPQKSLGRLIFEEFFSYFNVVNYILAAIVIYTGSLRNLLFMIIVFSNTFVGLYQKIHSRRILNKLALLHAQKYQVLRDGKWISLTSPQIVEGDIIQLKAGAQIPCDGVIRSGSVQVNESLLTGESDALDKESGSDLYGGCFLVSGTCLMQAVLVGDAQYMATILKDARREKEYPSQLRDVLNAIIRFCSWIIFPAGILLFVKLYFFTSTPLNAALLNTAASMIGMIPEGLVILTSVALMSAAVKMARKAVLIHELYCIENLARVDTLCLDKTGTITSGTMLVDSFVPWGSHTRQEMVQDLASLFGSLEDDNLTAQAIRKAIYEVRPAQKAVKTFPFSSVSKCSGAVFASETLLLGAYSFVFAHPDPAVSAKIQEYARKGLRVLVLAKAGVMEELAKGDYELLGLILIEDELRPNAAEILDYFKEQDVELKIISGDMTATVEAIANKAGVTGKAVDMSTIADDQIEQAVLTGSIFGRVSPMQKKLMVKALQKNGHTVAMTGDGVNDVMALKQADCSIAMGSGAQAAMAVASMVLLQDQFSALPQIVLQGRRVINNIQRTASLFLVKTLFSFLLTILTVLWMQAYPFVPIQLTLVSSIGTGIPSFILTFENDTQRPKGNFLVSVLSRAIPGALALSAGISLAYLIMNLGGMNETLGQFQSICTWLAAINAIAVLFYVCQPLSLLRLTVLCLSIAAMLGAFFLLPSIFMIQPLSWSQFFVLAGCAGVQEVLFVMLIRGKWSRLLDRLPLEKKEDDRPRRLRRKKRS